MSSTDLKPMSHPVASTTLFHDEFDGLGLVEHHVPGRIVEADNRGVALGVDLAGKTGIDLKLENAVGVIVHELRPGEHVGDVLRRGVIQIDVPVDAGHPPVVLILEDAAVGPADHDDGERVFAGADERGNVEFGAGARILRHADLDAVHIDEEAAFDTAEMQHETASGERCVNLERAPVDTGRILLRDEGRLVRPRHLNVRIMRLVIPLHGPVAGNGDPVPAGVVETLAGERLLDLLGTGQTAELPFAVQIHDLRTVERLERHLFRLLLVRERKQRGAAAQTVDARGERLLPEPDRFAIEQFHGIFPHI